VFGVIAPHQNEPAPGVYGRDLDHGEASRTTTAFSSKSRRNPHRAQAEPAQQKCQKSYEAKDKKQRQKKSDVLTIHE